MRFIYFTTEYFDVGPTMSRAHKLVGFMDNPIHKLWAKLSESKPK